MNKGKLYVVATPIGNLDDMTVRGVEILKKAPFVLAEDTRESKKLFNRYNINTRLVSYRDQNHEKMIEKIVEKLEMGLDLALISDCGTPLISDPGYKLVKHLNDKGYKIIPIPGPSAFVAALSVSGLPIDRFVFLGFLSKSKSKRESIIKKYIDTTIVLYESPKRLFSLLELVKGIEQEIFVFAIRDITKKREKSYRGNVNDVLCFLKEDGLQDLPHGEWVVILSSKPV